MSSLIGASLIGVNARHLNACGISAADSDWTNADLSHAKLDGSDFARANFNGARITHDTSMQGTNLIGATIQSAVYCGEDGSERPLRFSDIKDMGGIVAAHDLALERQQLGGFAQTVSYDHIPMVDQPMLTSLDSPSAPAAPSAGGPFGMPQLAVADFPITEAFGRNFQPGAAITEMGGKSQGGGKDGSGIV